MLADATNNSVIVWNATDFSKGSVYITDIDSTISWAKLYGLGRTISGGIATTDFSDIDSNLNMTGFNDSVYNVYTTAGTPNNLSNYTVFSRTVYYVPDVESINNSNFWTGILWDSNDDCNAEYDTSEKEDLVFVSKINKNAAGAFGNYDYEIRVPSKLAKYKGPDSSEAVFYVELV